MYKESKTAPLRENHVETRKIPAYFSLRYQVKKSEHRTMSDTVPLWGFEPSPSSKKRAHKFHVDVRGLMRILQLSLVTY